MVDRMPTRLAKRGLIQYNKIINNKPVEIGFYFIEFIIKILDRYGKEGVTVTRIRLESNGELSDAIIQRNLHELIGMNRVERKAIKGKHSKIKMFHYFLKYTWMDII